MSFIKCKMCGGNISLDNNSSVVDCEYCGTTQTVPKPCSPEISDLFNRANTLRTKGEFDRAEKIYEQIISSSPDESEAYWGLVLCKYGIEYVDDPTTFKKIPTCHRASFEPIVSDADYLSAIEYANVIQKSIYEQQAQEIDRIQKNILIISKNEQPYDVFICYKESDEYGHRTRDSVIANDIYYQLTKEGLKVFYAAISLEGKLGQEYEPIIFAALNSAKVMLAIGTRPEYFHAPWVRNEWSRFLKIMKNDRSKLLIPCYKDMDPYELPDEFARLQAQDMNKVGFIVDIIRGIKKIVIPEESANLSAAIPQTAHQAPIQAAPSNSISVENSSTTANNTIGTQSSKTIVLMQRAFLLAEDGQWLAANKLCEQVLEVEPTNAEAYLCKLMISLKARKKRDIANCPSPLTGNSFYDKALRFASTELALELTSYNQHIVDRIRLEEMQATYERAELALQKAKYKHEIMPVYEMFASIARFKDAAKRSEECRIAAEAAPDLYEIRRCQKTYKKAVRYQRKGDEKRLIKAAELFSEITDWKDSSTRLEKVNARLLDYEKNRVRFKKNKLFNKILLIAMFVICTLVSAIGAIPSGIFMLLNPMPTDVSSIIVICIMGTIFSLIIIVPFILGVSIINITLSTLAILFQKTTGLVFKIIALTFGLLYSGACLLITIVGLTDLVDTMSIAMVIMFITITIVSFIPLVLMFFRRKTRL